MENWTYICSQSLTDVKKGDRNTYSVVTATDPPGASAEFTVTIMVTDEVLGELGSRYDTDNDRVTDKREAIEAVRDYFNDGLSKEETIAIIRLYFASSS